MNKVLKSKCRELSAPNSKPAQLAKILYNGILRYIKAKFSQNRDKSSRLALDFNCERRVNVHTRKID